MLTLRITAPDGSVRAVPIQGPELTIGRAPDNAIVLDGSGVSSNHCSFVVQGSQCFLVDRGSTNGTYVNNERVQQSKPLADVDRIYVGQYLLQVLHGAGGVSVHPMTAPNLPAAGPGAPENAGGRILIQREDRAWRDQHNRLLRYAEQWDQAGRPDRLALRPKELRRARTWLTTTPEHQVGLITAGQREFIEFSSGANTRMAAKRFLIIAGIVLALGGLVTTLVMVWPQSEPEPEPTVEPTQAPAPKGEEPRLPEPVPERDPPRVKPRINKQIKHVMVPQETLDDVALRYGVTAAQIAEWNLLNPDDPGLSPGDTVKIKKPAKRPLPQQQIKYELEREDTSWTKLSKRFGISAKKLRSYNPDVKKLRTGKEVVIWIDPKPYKPREPRQAIPDYVPDRSALSVGSPNSGSLESGIQLPDNPSLYKRRYPYIMWGSGYLVANVQKAVAQFRQDMDFDGTLVMADISRTKGGHFYPPHKSHQAGRDIDIWLPTLRGVFKEKYLNEDGDEKWGRRPNPEEVDWFATWGLIKALLETDAVQAIFLSDSVQPSVYDAAKFLGVSDEELDYALQYPKGSGTQPGKVSHSPGHSHHMHVRFKCAPYEKRCVRHNVRGGGHE
ncbi:MAG: penicillin-insensitive murein endopeptidase [Myxococcota bacterium]